MLQKNSPGSFFSDQSGKTDQSAADLYIIFAVGLCIWKRVTLRED